MATRKTTQGDLNLTATQVAAQGDAQVQSAAALSLNAQQHEAHVVRGNGSRKDETQLETSNIQAGGSLLLQSAGDLTAQGSRLSAGRDLAAVSTEGQLRIDSPQNTTRTQIGADVRQSLQTERSTIEAGGNITLYGQEAAALLATRVNAGGNASVSSQGDVALGANTDTEQHNWTTSSTSRSWGGLQKKTTTTQHEQLDQEAERTHISAGGQAQVLGKNVASVGAQVSGQTLTQIEGADKTLLYDVQEVHQYSANSLTRSSFAGITYSKRSSNDSTFKSQALPTELQSQEAVRVGVGALTDVRGAILSAPQVGFYRSAGADPSTRPADPGGEHRHHPNQPYREDHHRRRVAGAVGPGQHHANGPSDAGQRTAHGGPGHCHHGADSRRGAQEPDRGAGQPARPGLPGRTGQEPQCELAADQVGA